MARSNWFVHLSFADKREWRALSDQQRIDRIEEFRERSERNIARKAERAGESPTTVDPTKLGDGKLGDGNGPEPSGSGGESQPGGRRNRGWRLFGGNGEQPKSQAHGKTTKKVDLTGIESVLLSLHLLASVKWAIPELELDPSEAKALADAAAEVARHYPITANPKAIAWAQLMIVASTVYGPRAVTVWDRRREKAGPAAALPRSHDVSGMGEASGSAQPATNGPFRPVTTPSELDPGAMLASQTSAGSA